MVSSQFHRTVRIALEIRATNFHPVLNLEPERGEHLALHFVNKDIWTEGRLFNNGRFG